MAVASIEHRIDIRIASSSQDVMYGWLYSSPRFTELKLDVYANCFNEMGYTGLVDWHQQQEDWKSAIKYTRQLKNVDPDQVGLFGTSFSGGHVIQLAAGDKRLKAAISQCPFPSGWASTRCTGISVAPKLAALGVLDTLFGSDERPITVSLIGKPGEAALMNAPDGNVPARLALKLPFLRPGSYTSRVDCPILFGICGKSSVTPADPTLAYTKTAPKGVIKWYDVGHFEIYYGEAFEKAIQTYKRFLQECLPVNG
ncbi:Alpha/Beta hydrolase protein [Aspergillus pseudoustus]|uniref:Alpha/Beta hydrolase protein n=1 Tax=Aspergillus pseudoustus TaxID=1810923 RepID=A0ABR4INC6_9EURO